MNLPEGTLLQNGKYRIVRFINSGGFGCTYEGVHEIMQTRVAIKEFFVNAFCNRDSTNYSVSVGTNSQREFVDKLRKKFIDEARAMFKMQHPGIVRVFDVFEENGTAYFVMDYIEGASLHQIVKQNGPLPENVAVEYIRKVADALRYVHARNRLHLDIKPGNIMLDADGNPILIDFGASKHYDSKSGEQTSTLLGVNTEGYAPHEQMSQSFSTFSPATDIYAMGATLYKLLTGITPPNAVRIMGGEEALLPLPATISKSTRDAIEAAMRPIRTQRPQNVDEFLAILNGEPSTATANAEHTVVDMSRVSENTVIANGASTGKDGGGELPVPPTLSAANFVPPTPDMPNPIMSPDDYDNSGNSRNKRLLWLIIIGVVVVGLVVGIILLLNNTGNSTRDDDDDDDDRKERMYDSDTLSWEEREYIYDSMIDTSDYYHGYYEESYYDYRDSNCDSSYYWK